MSDMLAGSVGFTWLWRPAIGSPDGLPTLTDLSCTMTIVQPDSGYRKTFPMIVAGDGLTASYTTQSADDFPVGRPPKYRIEFRATRGIGLSIASESYTRQIHSPI